MQHTNLPRTENIFVLCEQSNVQQVLHVLHNIVEYSSATFSDEAIVTYFGPNKEPPVILNHPRTDFKQGTYATSLASLATSANPQEETTPGTNPTQQAQTTKRKRDDNHRPNYAAAVGNSAHSAHTKADEEFQKMMKTLQSNLGNLEQLEASQNAQASKNQAIDEAIARLTTGQTNHGKLLQTLTNTQTAQGRLLNTLNTKVNKLCDLFIDKDEHEEQDEFQNDMDMDQEFPFSQDQDTSNPSQGVPGGLVP